MGLSRQTTQACPTSVAARQMLRVCGTLLRTDFPTHMQTQTPNTPRDAMMCSQLPALQAFLNEPPHTQPPACYIRTRHPPPRNTTPTSDIHAKHLNMGNHRRLDPTCRLRGGRCCAGCCYCRCCRGGCSSSSSCRVRFQAGKHAVHVRAGLLLLPLFQDQFSVCRRARGSVGGCTGVASWLCTQHTGEKQMHGRLVGSGPESVPQRRSLTAITTSVSLTHPLPPSLSMFAGMQRLTLS